MESADASYLEHFGADGSVRIREDVAKSLRPKDRRKQFKINLEQQKMN